MDNIFKRTSAHWVRYDKYEWKESTDGVLYLTPAKEAVMYSQEKLCGVSHMLKKIMPVTWQIIYNGTEIFNNHSKLLSQLN